MAPKRKAPEESSPAKRAKAEAKPSPKARAKAEPEPKGRAKAEPEPKGRAAAKAAPEPKPKAKATAKAAARATEADLENELNTMIQSAKDGEFDKVFEIIDKYPPYVNERPEERRWSTIHQACYWGELPVLKKLVEKYNADVFLLTKEGQSAIEVAKEHGHNALVKYLEAEVKKKSAPAAVPAGGRSREGDRSRISATRSDGADDADMDLSGVKKVTLKLGSDGGGILCGAALVYNGTKQEKAVCYCDRKYKTAIHHSGDSYVAGKSTHTIDVDLTKMPKEIDKVYLTLCACGPANLQKYTNPSVELSGEADSGPVSIRYNLDDAGPSQSTVMAVLEKAASSWAVSPVGAVSPAKFCGNYSAARALILSEGDADVAAASGGAASSSPKRKAPASPKKGSASPAKKGAAAASGDDPPGYSAAEITKMEEKKAEFASWTNAKLQSLLKDNDQSRTGNKAVLLAKCAYGAAFGKLGRCPKCFGGKVKFRLPTSEGKLYSLTTLFGGGSSKDKDDNEKEGTDAASDVKRRYYCTGYFDDDTKVECDWQADTTEHENWSSA